MSDPSEILVSRLERVLSRAEDSSGLHFFWQVGGTQHPYGMLTMQLSGAGTLLLGLRRGDAERELYSVRLLPTDAERFYRMLLEHPFWDAPPARRPARDSDELNVHIRLSDQAAGIWGGAQFWAQDAADHPTLGPLMTRLERLASSLSDGSISLPPLGA